MFFFFLYLTYLFKSHTGLLISGTTTAARGEHAWRLGATQLGAPGAGPDPWRPLCHCRRWGATRHGVGWGARGSWCCLFQSWWNASSGQGEIERSELMEEMLHRK